jgi:hypothetical protein
VPVTRKHSLHTAVGVCVTLLATAAIAAAAIDAFIKIGASGPNNDGTLTTNFKVGGLGSKETTTVTVGADATAVYICINKGGNVPSAANKQVLAGPVSSSGNFTSDKNGQVTGSLILPPPPPTLNCPFSQRSALAEVGYGNVAFTANDAPTESLSLNFTKVFIDYN